MLVCSGLLQTALAGVPNFDFSTYAGAPFSVTLYLDGPFSASIRYYRDGTTAPPNGGSYYFPDGVYSWYVTSSKFESLAGKSELWVFGRGSIGDITIGVGMLSVLQTHG